MDKIKQWISSHKPQTAGIAVTVVLALALGGVGIAYTTGAFTPGDANRPVTETKKTDKTKTEDEAKTAEVTLNVTADAGWDEASTPAIAHIKGTDGTDTEGVDFYHAVAPDAEGNKGASTVTLAEGGYTVSLISPVNADGSAYEVPGTGKPVDVTVDADTQDAPAVDCPMTRVPADEVTDEMLADIVEKTKDAVEGGDETLKGEAGTDVLAKLEANVAANANVTDETKQTAKDADKEVDVDGAPAKTAPKAPDAGNKGSDKGSDKGRVVAPAKPSAPSKPSKPSGTNASSSKPAKPEPKHEHRWVEHKATRQVWVENWVDVPDYETREISGGQLYTPTDDPDFWAPNGETYWFYTDADREAFHNLIINKIKNEDYTGSYINRSKTEKVQVGSHREDHGHWETETYVDYVYCADCGARK
ncbi:MAG: hypothetical protein Q4B91_02955 [Atopobiaceae bacterium]|nr:hypothetical protein [Atopobiaceae bacterium]